MNHANLRGHDHLVVFGDIVAARAQTVAVEHGANIVTVREHDRGGAVPRFHNRRVKLVEVALLLIHINVGLPRLWDHHHYRLL